MGLTAPGARGTVEGQDQRAMAKIRNFLLTPDLTEALASAAESVQEDLLLLWGREFLPGGFTRLESIRERLLARVRSDATLDDKLVDLLATGLPCCQTVAFLSLAALAYLFEPLSLLVGRQELLLAMLLNTRPDVHQFAIEQALKPAPTQPPTPQEEAAALDFVMGFVDQKLIIPVGLFPPPPAGAGPPSDLLNSVAGKVLQELNQKVQSQCKTIDRLNRELQQQKQRHLAKLKQQADALEQERKGLRAEQAAAQARTAALLREKQTLETRLKELADQREAAVSQAVQEQTSALVRKWLAEPLQLDAAVQAAGAAAGDLVARVEQALQAQARQDRHTGNRVELERRLEVLRGAQARAATALRHALTPIRELRPLLEELAAEITRLEKLLAGPRPVSELAGRLLTSLNSAETWEEVRGGSQLVEQLDDRRLLPAEDLRSLYNAIQRKFSLLAETVQPKAGAGDNGWALRDILFRNKNALLLLDGHNLLFGLKDIFSPDYENGYPGRKARQRLVDLVAKLVRARPNVLTKICFDGPAGASAKVAPNLEVFYSGGQGQNRADELIVSQLQFTGLKDLAQKVFVVSDDREVRRGILRTGASYVPCDLFAVFLSDFQCF